MCPLFLRQYSSAAEACADGMTVEIVKDWAAKYMLRFQGKVIHPLSDENREIHKLITEFVGPNYHVENLYSGQSSGNLDVYISGAHVMEVVNIGTFVVGLTQKAFDDQLKQKYKNLPIWRLIEFQNVSSIFARMLMTVVVLAGFSLIAIPIIQGLMVVIARYMLG